MRTEKKSISIFNGAANYRCIQDENDTFICTFNANAYAKLLHSSKSKIKPSKLIKVARIQSVNIRNRSIMYGI